MLGVGDGGGEAGDGEAVAEVKGWVDGFDCGDAALGFFERGGAAFESWHDRFPNVVVKLSQANLCMWDMV